jgi:hypothetical protein
LVSSVDSRKKRVVAIRKKAAPADLSDPLIRADRVLSEAMGAIRMLGAATPRNAPQERARLVAAFTAKEPALPRWSYARTDHSQLVRVLERLAARMAEPEDDALGPVFTLYAARARELALEANIASSVGTDDLDKYARQRFSPKVQNLGARADEVAREWAALTPDDASSDSVQSDAREAGSLLVQMEEAVSRLRLPFSVVVQPQLVALAATGERQIYVCAGRMLTREDVERTVMHEIEAHAIPRGRAANAKLGIFQVGTARGVDDQEGFALLLEERHGFMKPLRKRELGTRHVASVAMVKGADFAEVSRLLHDEYGLDWTRSVMTAERAFRGSNGKTAGLGRERIYLEAFGRVRAHLATKPEDEVVLSAGQVSIDAIPTLSAYV